MRARQIILAIICAASPLVAQERPTAEVTQESVADSLRRGVDFLIASQNKNGSWGNATKTKNLNIYSPVPGGHYSFRAGASGLALSGLIDANDPRPEARAAIERGGQWMLTHLPRLRRVDQGTTYNVWGHAYGLRALCRLYKYETDSKKKELCRSVAKQQLDLLQRFEDVNGGWGYLDLWDGHRSQRPSGITTSFMTATVLLAMHEARETFGFELNEKLLKTAKASIVRQRTPDFAYLYSHNFRLRPRHKINRPAGSLARSQVCNAALRVFGDDAITDEVIIDWAERFVEREGFLSIGRKRPVPHETHFAISGYFYYYGIFYYAEAVDLLPQEMQPKHADALAKIILHRQEKDGSWWDYPLYDYHQPYGTGYALMALAWAQDAMGWGNAQPTELPAAIRLPAAQ